MSNKKLLSHPVQRHIFSVLVSQRYVRFRDMRLAGTDTNLYSYHLKLLQKNNLVQKLPQGYTLAKAGYRYLDPSCTKSQDSPVQPNIIIMCVVQNSDGDLLLQERRKQPHVDQWTLPCSKVNIRDTSVEAAAQRTVFEDLKLSKQDIRRSGDCYIRSTDGNEVVLSVLAHVFRFESDDIEPSPYLKWVRPHKLRQYSLAPAVEKIVTRTFFNDPFFFEEFQEELVY